MGTNTGLGIGIGIPFKNFSSGGRRPLPPDLKASLKGVWIAYGKSNNDADRSIVKNLVDASNPFIISNAAFKLNSGFGGFVEDFTSWDRIDSSTVEISNDGSKIKCINTTLNVQYLFNSINRDIPSFKVKISNFTKGNITYYYRKEDGIEAFLKINPLSVVNSDKVIELPKSYNTVEGGTGSRGGFYSSNINIGVTITQIPSFEGAFVTDGIDDLITSTKTVQEMLGGSNEITVVSMAHFIKGESNTEICRINQIRRDTRSIRNSISKIGKSGIFGYTYKNGVTTINNILGDKNDCTAEGNLDGIVAPFSVEGYYYNNNSNPLELCSIAWYWTIIANKVLTTDQINQIIAYFNLDRTLNPDILCDVKKQGITNENHAEFGDKLIDFSGNGRDIQLNNLAWKGDSGIGKYEVDFLDSSIWNSSNSTITSSKIDCKNAISHIMLLYYSVGSKEYPDIPSFKVIKTGADIDYSYIDETGSPKSVKIVDGVNVLPASHNTLYSGSGRFCGFGNPGMGNSVTITQIPSHAGALWLDGVNDFGKVTGMPIYKDYTIIADYERFYLEPITGGRASILSKSSKVGDGSFIFNLEDQNGNKACYTFGEANGNISDDITRIIRYQSKYYNTKTLSIGTAEDNDFMVLGKVREADSRYFYGAIYSLMTFPYSMSEFLIERQLKKHKLGTLYPDMVEFRPVIKSNVLLDAKPTFVIRGTSTYLNAGDYVPENSQIWVSIKMNNIADRITKFTVNGKTINIPENAYSEVTLQYGFPFVIDKSPQKISITIEQDENYVLFNPVINSNYDNYKLTFHLREYEKLINIGDYILKGTYIRANLYLKNDIDELVTFTFNGVNIDYVKSSVSDLAYNIRQIYNYDSPQEVNITVDEYIRYEDIVQPYPVLLRFNDENGNEVSWGGKFKVGSTITRIGSVVDSNLLPNIYNIFGLLLNGNQVTSSKVIVEKTMVFKAKSAYIFDNNEPKCILSPRLLRIPNSSYKILGHIPDISGHGNHGKINNSAYAEGSGVNEDGSYQFDGVDDFVTIPTVSGGGKQVFMKIYNSDNRLDRMLYDQRSLGINGGLNNDFALYTESGTIAYKARNNGKTYIDGILNENITCNDLLGISQNITIVNTNVVPNNGVIPYIGLGGVNKNIYGKLALYDFMLFDEISTDDKIKELNEYVGIEAKVELPPYYWDTYGKTNLDGDKATIQQRGVAVGDYDLTNNNLAYEGMSGYNGYPVVFGENKTWVNLGEYYVWTVSATKFNITQLCFTKSLQFSYIKANGSIITANNKDIAPFRIKVTGIEPDKFSLRYVYLSTANATLESTITINSDGIYELPKSFASDGSLTSSDRWVGFSFIKRNTELADVIDGVNVTIEVLPEYENGLVYDGITNYSKNANIPAFDDFTAIIKREWLKKQGCPLIKGSKVYEGGNGNALLLEWDKAYNFVFYKRTDIMEGELPDNISFITPTNYNGNVITRGSEQDTNGICIAGDGNAGFANMVFYKLILYPKTIPLLQINFLKNLMERDEIIDLNNPIFIKNE